MLTDAYKKLYQGFYFYDSVASNEFLMDKRFIELNKFLDIETGHRKLNGRYKQRLADQI
jgi:hypothetical protein